MKKNNDLVIELPSLNGLGHKEVRREKGNAASIKGEP